MTKFKNKYRIETSRLKDHDYSQGSYFITICTRNRVPYFAVLNEDELDLTEIGEVALSCWEEIPEHFTNVQLGPFVVMPDHVHGILSLTPADKSTNPVRRNVFGPQKRNLASVLKGYKIGVNKLAKQINFEFAWQYRYWDTYLRNNEAQSVVTEYIMKNHEQYISDHFLVSPSIMHKELNFPESET